TLADGSGALGRARDPADPRPPDRPTLARSPSVADAPRSTPAPTGAPTSIVRTVLAAALVIAGIAWMAVFINVAQDGQKLTWMGDVGRWNFLIGLAVLFIGLIVASHPSAPLGRGRGVIVGMLGCFLIGLVWIDRKSTRLNSSHVKISYAVFCLKKKTNANSTTVGGRVEVSASVRTK